MHWHTARFQIDLSRPRVMGIVNLTPDSFSDGGQYSTAQAGIAHCHRLVEQGADVLDLGAESSRPGALTLTIDEEWGRLAPVLAQAVKLGVPISIDTCKPEVMSRALAAGADIINDIHALERPGALDTVLATRAGVCLMHMRGEPQTMQGLADYEDVVAEVTRYLGARLQAVQDAGMAPDRVVLDPGYGFAKTSEHNLALLRRQAELLGLGRPMLAGLSRKRMLGDLTGKPPGERVAASVAAALLALQRGASLIRVHDVSETVDALKVWMAVSENRAQISKEHKQ
ncbi:MAG: dihydropteroate synthase [Paucibacter sp.]|nr:dihydropteroate synthase [Roseateles sp.]